MEKNLKSKRLSLKSLNSIVTIKDNLNAREKVQETKTGVDLSIEKIELRLTMIFIAPKRKTMRT